MLVGMCTGYHRGHVGYFHSCRAFAWTQGIHASERSVTESFRNYRPGYNIIIVVQWCLCSYRLYVFCQQESDIDALSPDGEKLDHLEGSIEFSNVTFAYPSRNDLQVLHELNLSIKPGQTVALVGASGCGKSTVMKLIPRIYEYNIGNVSRCHVCL